MRLHRSFVTSKWILIAGGSLAVLLASILIPAYGAMLLLGVVVLLLGLLILLKPLIGVYILIFSIPLENVFVFGGEVTWARVLGVVVFAAWLLGKVAYRESWKFISGSSLPIPAVLFMVVAFVSSLWATEPAVIPGAILTLVQLLVLSLMLLDLLSSWRRVRWSVLSVLLGGVVASGVTLWQYYSLGFLRAGSNVSGNVNETAKILVLLLPLAFYAARTEKHRIGRLLGILCIILSSWAVLITFSRTAYLFLAFVLLLQLGDYFREDKSNLLRFAILGVMAVIFLFQFVPWREVELRANSIQPYLAASETEGEGLGGSTPARLHHWFGAAAIFYDHPILGVGYKNFGYHFSQYQFQVPEKWFSRVYNTIRSPHSTVLGLLAEVGLLGSFVWAGIFVVTFRNLHRSRKRQSTESTADQPLFIRILFQALIVYMLMGVVAVTHFDKLLWVYLGFSEALRSPSLSESERPEFAAALN